MRKVPAKPAIRAAATACDELRIVMARDRIDRWHAVGVAPQADHCAGNAMHRSRLCHIRKGWHGNAEEEGSLRPIRALNGIEHRPEQIQFQAQQFQCARLRSARLEMLERYAQSLLDLLRCETHLRAEILQARRL